MAQVLAHFVTDDGAYECDFDATPYFDASHAAGTLGPVTEKLSAIGFRHDYEADALAYDALAREPIIAAGIAHCEKAMSVAQAQGSDTWPGFEVEIAVSSLRAYLSERAPELLHIID